LNFRPPFACSAIYKYEDLSKAAEQRALGKRTGWLERNFGEVTKTFSQVVVTAADLSSLLRKVETDLSLVHAAYYTDDECINRIATGLQESRVVGALSETVRMLG
jgi:hypothetical protein